MRIQTRHTWKDGYTWMLDGDIHRDDGPAVFEDRDGGPYTAWYHHGMLHRFPDPDGSIKPTIQCEDLQSWYWYDVRHRLDGPAWLYNGAQWWYRHGVEHRDPEDGPAVIFADGGVEYWENGVEIRDEKRLQHLRQRNLDVASKRGAR